MTFDSSYGRFSHSCRTSNMVSLQQDKCYDTRLFSNTTYSTPMMTRYHSWGHFYRTSYKPCTTWTTLWNITFYYIWGVFLYRLFLGILPLKPGTNTRNWRYLTPKRDQPPKPTCSPTIKHCSITGLGCDNHLGPSRLNKGRPNWNNPGPNHNYPTWHLFYYFAGNRVLRGPLYNCGRNVRINIFCCNRIPRYARYYRHYFFSHLSLTTHLLPFYNKPPLRLRGCSLVLALRRCCMTIFILIHLLMGHIPSKYYCTDEFHSSSLRVSKGW